MIPVVALVGRPNVGKSTLFNRLTRSREALVAAQPGVTRDRLYGEALPQDRRFLLIDTGGLSDDGDVLSAAVREQVFQAQVLGLSWWVIQASLSFLKLGVHINPVLLSSACLKIELESLKSTQPR